ncbi:hypothetical protein HPP92_006243 [Vanilla planifolia]|uniref:DUF4220 domain-containing protein n=1 Tax=Vanilla planifolia TaxID=51239 RepID=A0A835VC45_VANPL|nr:hypothetical protein HPP92_006243 [Vanilla planifolia]
MAVWSNYLLANWVTNFILGQLSSSMYDNSNKAILAFWVPFLLLHLGGQDTITTNSMEDNKLWAQHLLAFAYKLIIVAYVLFLPFPTFSLDVIPLVDVYKVIRDMLKAMNVKDVLGLTSMELNYAYDEMYTAAPLITR